MIRIPQFQKYKSKGTHVIYDHNALNLAMCKEFEETVKTCGSQKSWEDLIGKCKCQVPCPARRLRNGCAQPSLRI